MASAWRKGPRPIIKVAADGSPVTAQIKIYGFRLLTTPAAVGACTVVDDLGATLFKGVTSTAQGTDEIMFQDPIELPGYQLTAISGTNAELHIYAG